VSGPAPGVEPPPEVVVLTLPVVCTDSEADAPLRAPPVVILLPLLAGVLIILAIYDHHHRSKRWRLHCHPVTDECDAFAEVTDSNIAGLNEVAKPVVVGADGE